MKKVLLFAGFVATVYGANWAVQEYGIVHMLGSPITAPAGVYFAGLALGLRDALHEAAEASWRWWVLGAITLGAALSYVVGDAITLPGGHLNLALASAIAFGCSELMDLAVYAPLREGSWPLAVGLSNFVGACVDSALFLWLAFGSLEFFWGQVIGKELMALPAVAIVWWARRDRSTLALA